MSTMRNQILTDKLKQINIAEEISIINEDKAAFDKPYC